MTAHPSQPPVDLEVAMCGWRTAAALVRIGDHARSAAMNGVRPAVVLGDVLRQLDRIATQLSDVEVEL